MREKETEDILTLIAEAEADRVHPRNIARQLKGYFDGTAHNALTAARTEAQKLRADARSEYFREAGVEYVQYIAAMDERTRPEHAARNGKIYRHSDAPWLGEYNCRCTLAPADYLVNRKGAKVEDSQVEILQEKDISE
jgi:SPP1 gp7 family putative phage head morphogenesis protein